MTKKMTTQSMEHFSMISTRLDWIKIGQHGIVVKSNPVVLAADGAVVLLLLQTHASFGIFVRGHP